MKQTLFICVVFCCVCCKPAQSTMNTSAAVETTTAKMFTKRTESKQVAELVVDETANGVRSRYSKQTFTLMCQFPSANIKQIFLKYDGHVLKTQWKQDGKGAYVHFNRSCTVSQGEGASANASNLGCMTRYGQGKEKYMITDYDDRTFSVNSMEDGKRMSFKRVD